MLEQIAHALRLELAVVGPDHRARLVVDRESNCFGTPSRIAALSRRLGPVVRAEGVAVAHAEPGFVDGAEICAFAAFDGLVLVATGPAHPRPPSLAGLRRLYGLTPTEARVARALANSREGHSPGTIAVELEVELSTVRTHLRVIQQKLNAESQTDLVRRLLSSAAIAVED